MQLNSLVAVNTTWPPFVGPRCIVPTQWISTDAAHIYEAAPGYIWVGLQVWSMLFKEGFVVDVWTGG